VQGNPEVVSLLNEILTAELTAINQYFLDAKMMSNWGFERLGERFHQDSIEEMKDADALIERILYFDGMPNLQRLNAIRIGETAVEKIQLALEVEREAIERLNRGIALAVTHADNGTRELLEDMLTGEEEQANWLETQLAAINTIGAERYLAEQLHG
jgi:bacterioferritin